LHRFCKERRRSPRGCFERGDTTHFITDCPKRKKLDSSSNKYDYTKWNDYIKGDDMKKYRFRDNKKMMSQACAATAILTSLVMTPPAPRRMRGPSARWTTSSAFASWVSRRGTSPTLTPMQVMTHPPMVFLCESLNLKMLFATNASCLVRLFARIKS
jgi:hypothetical protein